MQNFINPQRTGRIILQKRVIGNRYRSGQKFRTISWQLVTKCIPYDSMSMGKYIYCVNRGQNSHTTDEKRDQ